MTRPAMPESETQQCSICLSHPPYGGCAGDESCAYLMQTERRLAQAQTRIAELEKAIYESRMPHGLCHVIGSCAACTAQQALDGIAIDAALKSRP